MTYRPTTIESIVVTKAAATIIIIITIRWIADAAVAPGARRIVRSEISPFNIPPSRENDSQRTTTSIVIIIIIRTSGIAEIYNWKLTARPPPRRGCSTNALSLIKRQNAIYRTHGVITCYNAYDAGPCYVYTCIKTHPVRPTRRWPTGVYYKFARAYESCLRARQSKSEYTCFARAWVFPATV